MVHIQTGESLAQSRGSPGKNSLYLPESPHKVTAGQPDVGKGTGGTER
jgi:hypothetical protein